LEEEEEAEEGEEEEEEEGAKEEEEEGKEEEKEKGRRGALTARQQQGQAYRCPLSTSLVHCGQAHSRQGLQGPRSSGWVGHRPALRMWQQLCHIWSKASATSQSPLYSTLRQHPRETERKKEKERERETDRGREGESCIRNAMPWISRGSSRRGRNSLAFHHDWGAGPSFTCWPVCTNTLFHGK